MSKSLKRFVTQSKNTFSYGHEDKTIQIYYTIAIAR